MIRRLRALGHPLCVGLDPHLERLPPLFRVGSMDPLDPRTAAAVAAFLKAVVDRAARRVALVKPQIAFFERLGWPGISCLAEVVDHARAAGLLVLLDAKRGDIGSTAAAYAAAYLGEKAPLPVDAITLHPYLGRDSLDPFAAAARRHGRGLFVLAKTSNPGSADFQDKTISESGRPLSLEVAAALGGLCDELRGPETGFSSLGLVAGATWPQQSQRLRDELPAALFLVPGYGAQGASARDALAGFVAGPRGREGGVVNSSRGILFPPGSDVDGAGSWERAIDEALERAIGELGEAATVV